MKVDYPKIIQIYAWEYFWLVEESQEDANDIVAREGR
jgi:hypothetical protein